MPSNLRRAQDEYAEICMDSHGGTVRYASTVDEAVRCADVMIDFVPDELESKLEIISMADRMAPPQTILCIPTNCLSIADLASCTYRRERCVGLRGPMTDLFSGQIELIRTSYCDALTLVAVSDLLRRMAIPFRVGPDSTEPRNGLIAG